MWNLTPALFTKPGQSLIVEANFRRDLGSPELRAVQRRHRPRTIQLVCRARDEVLRERFQRRATSAERHPGHVDYLDGAELIEKALQRPQDWGALDIAGEVLYVDTSNWSAVDVGAVVANMRALMV